jgi:uncharacterized protein YecE (DUF72 family)
MTNLAKKVFIGTSGWSYSHWKENFYPKGLKSKDWLNYYSTTFSTVEVNSTFYRLPLLSTVQNWNSQVPKNFLFAVKASRYMTHQKRLKDCEDAWVSFSKVMKNLKSKIGPILFQLPPSFKMDKDRLIEFMSCLNDEHEYVFEFRNATWFIDEIYALLSKKKIALCITDLNGHLSPEEITAHFTYIRLHGPKKAYQGSYGISKLKLWKKKIEKWASKTSVYCYFDNDEKGFAIEDAKSLQDLLEKS